MLVRIKKSVGNYGLVRNGTITPKNFSSGAFEVTEEEGGKMLRRGIAEAVEQSTAEAAPAAEGKPKAAKKRSTKKQQPVTITEEEGAEFAPAINAASAVC